MDALLKKCMLFIRLLGKLLSYTISLAFLVVDMWRISWFGFDTGYHTIDVILGFSVLYLIHLAILETEKRAKEASHYLEEVFNKLWK